MRVLPRLALLLLIPGTAAAQTVSGTAYWDLDGDGRRGPGDPPLAGLPVRLFGTTSGGAPFDLTVPTAADGTFVFVPGNGSFLILPAGVPGGRPAPVSDERVASSTPGYSHPVGRSRYGGLPHGPERLLSGAYRYVALGDSIAWNFNVCNYTSTFWYSRQVRGRLAAVAPGAAVQLDEGAIKGEHTDDLLVEDLSEFNNVFRMIRPQAGEPSPDLVTISIIGNDLLNVDITGTPTQAATNTAIEEILDARRNLQEVLSVLASETPGADVALHTLYDNLAYDCPARATSPFHRDWLPIVNRILRDLAWGQTRPAAIVEAAAEFGAENLTGGCSGFPGQICRDLFGFDRIHPNNAGYQMMREKVWEAAGGILLGPSDPLGRASRSDADFGFVPWVRRLHPTAWEARSGAAVTDPAAALGEADGGAAAAIRLGAGAEEFRVTGFPDWYDEIRIARLIAGARYRTTGAMGDDAYRIEASLDGVFEPPAGHAYTPTDWNYSTPLVGGGGPNRPAGNPDYPDAALLVLPDVPAYREVSSTLSMNPVRPPGAAEYVWPAPAAADLAGAAVRVVSAPLAGTSGNDSYEVELDAAWLDLYGWEEERPEEVGNLRVDPLADGGLAFTFDALPGAQRYNLYAGRAASLDAGYDHGGGAPAGPVCGAAVEDAGAGRLRVVLPAFLVPAEDAYFLFTAHRNNVESPAGFGSSGAEIDRAQSTCR